MSSDANYRYEAVPGYEKRKTWKGKGTGSGRPAWEEIEALEALRTARTYHDFRGAQIALDTKLTELVCGSVMIRRKRKRVRIKVGDEAAPADQAAPEASDDTQEGEDT